MQFNSVNCNALVNRDWDNKAALHRGKFIRQINLICLKLGSIPVRKCQRHLQVEHPLRRRKISKRGGESCLKGVKIEERRKI